MARLAALLRGRFRRQVAVTLATQVAGVALAIAGSAIIARWLGPSGKGALALILLLPSLLSLFLGAGIEVSNVYFLGSRRLSLAEAGANSVAVALSATAAGAVILLGLVASGALGAVVPGVAVGFILLGMLIFPLTLLNGYLSTLLIGLQRIALVNLLSLGQNVVKLGLTALALIVLNGGLAGAILAAVAAGAVQLVVMGALLARLGAVFLPRWDRARLRMTLSFGLKGYVGNLLQFFNYRLDMFLVNFFLGVAGAGIYSVAVGLAELLWHLPNAVGFVIFPKAAADTAQAMNRFTPRVFRITLALTAAAALVLAAAGRLMIGLIYGAAFAEAYLPFLGLLPGVILLGGAKVLTNEIAGRGFPQYNSLNAGLALVVTLVLDVVLIPRLGVLGAALASSVAYSATFGMAVVSYRIVSRRTPSAREEEPA